MGTQARSYIVKGGDVTVEDGAELSDGEKAAVLARMKRHATRAVKRKKLLAKHKERMKKLPPKKTHASVIERAKASAPEGGN